MRQVIEVPIDLSEKEMGRIAVPYARVFAGWPWLEVSKCGVCGSFSANNPEEATPCKNPGCTGVYSKSAYPEMETEAYIRKEMSKPMASGILQVKMEAVRMTIEEILGFGWGYASTSTETAQEKYQTQEMQKILSDLLVKAGLFFYISEVGVDPNSQGKGIGKKLTSQLSDEGKKKLGTVVLRTNEDSPMRYIAQELGMKPIIGLGTGIVDKENEMRVVFVGSKYGRE